MEEHSPVDISIRNVAVRLNDTNAASSEMNGECVNSLFIPSSGEDENQVTHFNEDFEGKCSSNPSDLADEVREKLHISRDTSSSGLLNGCNKFLRDEMNCVDFSVNGISKSCHIELLNAHYDHVNRRTCVNCDSNQIEIKRTEFMENDLQKAGNAIEIDLPLQQTSDENNYCNALNKKSDVADSESEESISKDLQSLTVESDVNITYLRYDSESQMPDIMRLIQKDLSEPYSIYTYRYFIHNWPKLCFLAQDGDRCVGAIVCKLDVHKKHSRRGYIAMLAVDEKYRKRKIGSNLVLKAIHAMVQDNADEVVLETEITNKPALRLYENLGFVRDKRLFRYYLNGVDALRLKLWLR